MSRCTYCRRSAEVTYHIGRKGGGNYKRGSRMYPNQLCAECVTHLLENTERRQGWESVDRYSIGSLRRIAAGL